MTSSASGGRYRACGICSTAWPCTTASGISCCCGCKIAKLCGDAADAVSSVMRFAAPLGHRIDFGARWGRGRFAALRRWESPFEADGSRTPCAARAARCRGEGRWKVVGLRSEEHTSELQSLMRISYAVFCLKKKKTTHRPVNKKRDHY